MRSFLNELIQQVEVLSMTEILTQILVAAALGFVIYLSYYMSHTGTIYSRKFNTSLVVLAVRTAIKDSRDTVYIFWTVVVGLTCGVGDYITAGIGSAIVFLILLVLGRIKNESRMLLIVRGARSTDKRIMSVVSEYFSRRIDLRVENTTEQTVELIYEIPLKIFEKASNRAESIADCLYEIEHVEYVNVVAQDDDISN